MDFNKTRYIPMSRRRRIYEGKAKVLYEGPEPGTLIQHFKDDATAFNAKKHQVIEGKGVLNNRIWEYLFQHLNDIGVPTHFIRRLNMREQLIREVEIVPLEVVVRVRREWLDIFGRICAANLTGPLPLATGEWIELRLRFAGVKAARTLLSFGANVEVISPPEVRAELAAVALEIVDLYSNVRLG